MTMAASTSARTEGIGSMSNRDRLGQERPDVLRVHEQVRQFLHKFEERQDDWRRDQNADALPGVVDDFSKALDQLGHAREATTSNHLTQVGASHHDYSHDQVSAGGFASDPLMSVIALVSVVQTLNDTFDALQKVNDLIDSPQVQETVQQMGATLADAWNQFKEGAGRIIEDIQERMTELVSPEQTHDYQAADEPEITMDAQLAPNPIERATDEINQEMTLRDAFDPAAEAKLKQEFGEERQKLENKLDKNEDKYFEKHPDLSPEEKDAAEKKFDAVRDDAVQKLADQQAERLAEMQARQQAEREESERRRRELENLRADR
jgi:hypothetical protein